MTDTAKKPKTPSRPRKTAASKATVTEISAHVVPTHEEVSRLAHQYWIERGHAHGHHVEDWFRAEQDLRGKAS